MEPLPPGQPLHWRRCGHWKIGLALAAGLHAMMMVSTDPMTSCGGDCEDFAQFFHRQWPLSAKEARILIPDAASVLTKMGLQEPVDVAFIGTSAIFKILSEDASLADEDKAVVEILSRTMFELAAASKDGWTELTVRRIFREVDQAPRRVRPPRWATMAAVPKSRLALSKRVDKQQIVFGKLTMSILDGDTSPPACPPLGSLLETTSNKIEETLREMHSWLRRELPGCPRLQELGPEPSDLELRLQLDTYKGGSRSHEVIRGRWRSAMQLWSDIQGLGWDFCDLSPWRVAAWCRAQREAKTSGAAKAKRALVWIDRCTGYTTFREHELVKVQLTAARGEYTSKPEGAKMPSVEVAVKLEEQIWNAPTVQLQIYAAMATHSVVGSCRFSDAQRCRDLRCSETAFFGMRLTKTSNKWEPWQASATGIGGGRWAEKYLELLDSQNLPGPDYMAMGINGRCTDWQNRPGAYHDGERALRLLLMLQGMSPDEALEHTWHGLRHLYITVASQLQVPNESIEDLGSWKRGSGMVDV